MRFARAAALLALTGSIAACGGSDGSSTSVAPPTNITGLASELVEGDIVGVIAYEIGEVVHTKDPVKYPTTPPVGGDHSPAWQNCGAYEEPIPNEQGVHSMEHGAVWITYDPTLAAADVTSLQAAAKGQTHILVSPFPELGAKVVASAWGIQLKLDSASDPRLKQFVDTYQQGPQTPEPGAPCNEALGTPL
jgi:Protein of unknown function (DUF3105)